MSNQFTRQFVTLTEDGAIPLDADIVLVNAPKVISLTLSDPTPDLAGRTIAIHNFTGHSLVVVYKTGFDGQGSGRDVATFGQDKDSVLQVYVRVNAPAFWSVDKDFTSKVWFA